jgi:hypothetical protein
MKSLALMTDAQEKSSLKGFCPPPGIAISYMVKKSVEGLRDFSDESLRLPAAVLILQVLREIWPCS